MDRFIDALKKRLNLENTDLKSNMDRFIERGDKCTFKAVQHLKSNMDRFIAVMRISQS